MIRRDTRPISWVKAARKAFDEFPESVRSRVAQALTYAAEGQKADFAEPMTGLGSGVCEIVLPFRGDAYRVVYAVKLGDDVWVIHAFKKKSRTGVKTPQTDINLIRSRIKRLKEGLK
jgi:phage-related protein